MTTHKVDKCSHITNANLGRYILELKTNPTSYPDLEPESSLAAGPAALSGDEPIGVGLGGLLLDGKIPGLSAGVVELEGISAETGGAPAGVIEGGELVGVNEGGELEGVEAGGEAVGGEIDGLEEEGGVAAGGWICGGGVVVGDVAGGDDVVGELAGGDDEGDLEGGVVVGVDLGDGEGEFWA
ncbi:hypothetical protein Gotur_016326 [Gossypium turneri]